MVGIECAIMTDREGREGMEGEPARIAVVVGPTAGGKSEVAVRLAEALDGEIINADSMQVYRRLEVGTAKPTVDQRARVPHHLVDVVEPTEPWTVADWLEAAEGAIAAIRGRGRLPIVVGGTNLYLKALLEGFFEGPPADPAFRATLAEVPAPRLHERLEEADPVAAARIDRRDHKRLVRALEVYHTTGQRISELQRQWEARREQPYRHRPVIVGLDWPRERINRRINARVKAMFEPTPSGSGGSEDLIEETRRLEAAGLLGAQAREALGTKQVRAYLAGELTRAEAIERVKIETRRFAKQQRTWLKRYRGVHWLEAGRGDPDELAAAAIRIVAEATGRTPTGPDRAHQP